MVKSQPTLRYALSSMAAFALMALLSACSSNNLRTTKTEKYEVKNQEGVLLQASQAEFVELVHDNPAVTSRILKQYASWKGVRYRMGGNTRRGIDCSAFVQRTFHEQFGIDLPRSTAEQKSVGFHVAKSHLKAGDLVLFRSGTRGRHIGIYLGHNRFVHASTSSGVMISSLDDKYWKNRYREGRRVIKSTSNA
jgi:murein DD-endopeptidase / murein LD-carboxypeptidase